VSAAMRGILIRWLIIALAFAFTAWLLGGVDVSGGVWGYVWVSALFGIINVILGSILRLISLPLTILTLGLFLIVINAILLEVTDAITGDLTINSFFWDAIWASIIMSIATVILEYAFRGVRRR
jgi:putative membrane protein